MSSGRKTLGRIKDVSKNPDAQNYYNIETEKAVINGDKYPMFIAKIINKVLDDEQPFILFLGKPGSGKTMAAARLGEIMHEDIGFYSGDFTASKNIHYDNLTYLKSALSSTWQVKHKPEINTTLNALDYNDKGNRKFEKFVNLSRVFHNLITGDAQRLSRCDRAVRENHTFRLVATGGSEDYAFDVFYIERPADSDYEDYEKHYLMTWRPDLPKSELESFIEDKDKEWKRQELEEDIEELEKKRENEEEEIVRA